MASTLATNILGLNGFDIYSSTPSSNPNSSSCSSLLAYRYEARLPTIMTTNIANVEIRPKYGDRIAARMNEMFDIIVMPDIDFRVKVNEYTFFK
jgi:DNA replication protein DnaC